MLILSSRNKTQGFTFTELLVALTLNVMLSLAIITVFLSNMSHYRKSLNINRLYQQLQMAMTLMSNDIRRAGYWSNASGDIGTNQNNNPFMAAGMDISVNAAHNCILFSYDHDNNGSAPSISINYDDERYGYRLTNQTLQIRPPGSSFSCSSNDWENVTDPNVIQITNLTFTLNTSTVTTGPGAQGIAMRSVDITLTGQLTSDNTITRTITQHIRLRNDKFIP